MFLSSLCQPRQVTLVSAPSHMSAVKEGALPATLQLLKMTSSSMLTWDMYEQLPVLFSVSHLSEFFIRMRKQLLLSSKCQLGAAWRK